jgi:hypothetical protein
LRVGGYFFEVMQAFEKIGLNRLSRFDFDGFQLGTFLNEPVYLVVAVIAPEVETGVLSPVQHVFQ